MKHIPLTTHPPADHLSAQDVDPPMDPKGAADYLGLAVLTLADLRCKGGGPVFYKAGRLVRYRKSTLDAWLESRSFTSTTEYKKGA